MKTVRFFCFVALCIAQLFAQTVTPRSKQSGLFYFQFANIYLEIDSTVGGRISSLKVDDRELLFVNRAYAAGPYWGSCLWLSPQDGKERPAEIDQNAYTGGIRSNEIVLVSAVAKAIPLCVIKRLRADSTDTSLTITYDIVNRGTSTISKAAWELTRILPAGSLTFWPTGTYLSGGLASKVTKNGSYSWYPFSASDPSGGTKFFADGAEGWYGHVTGNGVLFVKKLTDVPRANQAPNEAEIELWLSGDHQYIELENQSAYRQISPNDTLHYTVKWYLRKLPSTVTVSVGSQSLITYSRIVARIDPPPTGTRLYQPPKNYQGKLSKIPVFSKRAFPEGPGPLYTLQGVAVSGALTKGRGLYPGIYVK